MSDIAIRCEGLSKRYRIGQHEQYRALRDVLTDTATASFRRLRAVLRNGNGSSSIGNVRSDNGNNIIWALDQVSFEVQRGEVVGIIGRNGAGKSTLLKILSRITKPTKGQAEIHGRVGSLLEVGTGFHPELTGRENIYLNGAMLGMRKSEIDRKFDEIVAFAEVEKFIDTPVKRFSSGMYVRLAFAVAAHLETEVLLVDEVLAVGDAAFQKQCLGKMNDVAKHGRTVLFVSHDMNAMRLLCERAIHLERGRIESIGDTTEQVTNYLRGKKNRSRISREDPICLGDKLELRAFEFMPNPVVSGSLCEFNLELSASESVTLDEVAVLIYSPFGKRLAILDLRKTGEPYTFNPNQVQSIKGLIRAVPFVEGEYYVGLYLNWGEARADFHDLLNLTVFSSTPPGDLVPYRAAVKGIVQLDYSLR